MTRAGKSNRPNLYLHWPVGAAGTPARVSTELVRRLLARRDELPFELSLVAPRHFRDEAMKLTGASAVTVSEFPFVARPPGVLHLPVSAVLPGLPTPNTLARLWLHATALMRGLDIVTNYHGLRFDGFPPCEWFRRTRNLRDLLLGFPDYLLGGQVVAGNRYIIAPSPFMASALVERFGNVTRVVTLGLGIDDWWFDEEEEPVPPIEGDPAIFYHGDLSMTKGVPLLLEAFARLRAQGRSDSARLYLAGGGFGTAAAREDATKLGLQDSVVFLGHLEQRSIKAYLRQCDAAIYPSVFDSFSNAVLEAMTCVRGPVFVSTRAGISSYHLFRELGLHRVEPTVGDLSRALRDLTSGAARDRAAQQQEFARAFTWSAIIDDYLVFYKNLAEELF